jgi:predicted nucleic acid-binding protein
MVTLFYSLTRRQLKKPNEIWDVKRRKPSPTQLEFEVAAAVVVPKDAPILAGAVACGADYLATFDRQHLIGVAIRDFAPNLIITTPGDILGQIR